MQITKVKRPVKIDYFQIDNICPKCKMGKLISTNKTKVETIIKPNQKPRQLIIHVCDNKDCKAEFAFPYRVPAIEEIITFIKGGKEERRVFDE